MQNSLVYFLDGKTYINVTNACTNSCVFCIRDIKEDVCGSNLRIEGDVSADDIIKQFTPEALSNSEITFCGYGEPLLKLDVVKEVCAFIRQNAPEVKIRVNTNGHASFVLKKNVPAELKGLVDCLSISLNAESAELYNEICKPNIEGAYFAMLDFAKQSVEEGFETFMSVVTGFDPNFEPNIEKCTEIVQGIGAKMKIREWIKEGY